MHEYFDGEGDDGADFGGRSIRGPVNMQFVESLRCYMEHTRFALPLGTQTNHNTFMVYIHAHMLLHPMEMARTAGIPVRISHPAGGFPPPPSRALAGEARGRGSWLRLYTKPAPAAEMGR